MLLTTKVFAVTVVSLLVEHDILFYSVIHISFSTNPELVNAIVNINLYIHRERSRVHERTSVKLAVAVQQLLRLLYIMNGYILKDFENASPRLNPSFLKQNGSEIINLAYHSLTSL